MLFAIAALFLAATLGFHCVTTLVWVYEQRRGGGCLDSQTMLRKPAWWLEMLAIALAAVTWPLAWLPRSTAAPGDRRPVALVHGWGWNRASMGLLAARLGRDGRAVYPVQLGPFGADIEARSALLAAELRRISAAAGHTRVDVVAHGLGGLVVRLAALRHAAVPVLGNVVTLGSPHRGTALAFLSRGRLLGGLRPGSGLLRDLEREDELPTSVNVAAVASPMDTIVFPLELAYYTGALNVTVESVGHHTMLYSDRIYRLVKENVDCPMKAPRE